MDKADKAAHNTCWLSSQVELLFPSEGVICGRLYLHGLCAGPHVSGRNEVLSKQGGQYPSLLYTGIFNPFTPKSDQCQISPAASPIIVHHTVWRTWLFITHSDERWLHYQFSLPHLYIFSLKGSENVLFESSGVKGLNPVCFLEPLFVGRAALSWSIGQACLPLLEVANTLYRDNSCVWGI